MYRRFFNPRQHGEVYQNQPLLQLRSLPRDSRSIVIFVSGGAAYSQRYRHIQAAFSVFFGPSSFRNIASYVPRHYQQCRDIAELFAISATLQSLLKIIATNQFALPISRVVICTCSPELRMAVAHPRLSRKKRRFWLRSRGHRVLMKDVLERLVQLESLGLEVLFNLVSVDQTWESYGLMPPIY
ncbi:hypothetical protein IFR05_003966 [Cadophora sp. M221]|nr:hypothetical protein IFR05_003966 [Cadophora sp. M221]